MGFEELWVLPDVFQRVCRRTEDGERFTAQIIKYIEKRSKIEAAYAKSISTAAGEVFKLEMELGTLKGTWDSLKAETEAAGGIHDEFSTKLVELAEEYKAKHMEERKNRALIVAKGSKLLKDLNAIELAMRKARTTFIDLRKGQDKSIQAHEKAKQTGEPKKEQASQKEVEKAELKAEKADNEYRIAVNSLKTAQDQYYDKDLIALLREFEGYELSRNAQTRSLFDKLVTLHEAVGPSTRDSTDRLRKKVAAINAKQDQELFVSQQEAKKLEPPGRAVYQAYDSVNPDTGAAGGASRGAAPAPPEKKKLGLGGLLGGLGKKDDKKPKDEKKEDKPPKSPGGNAGTSKIETSGPRMKTQPDKKDDVGLSVSLAQTTSTSTASEPKKADPVKVEVKAEPPKEQAPSPSAAPAGEEKMLVALYDYDATEDNEISFKEGEKLVLLEQDDSGWWKGRNTQGQVGVFPSNFVEPVGDAAGAGGSAAPAPGTTVNIDADFKALYDYEAEDATELTIREGEVLRVKTETDGWYFGVNKDGKSGNFPSNFVEKV